MPVITAAAGTLARTSPAPRTGEHGELQRALRLAARAGRAAPVTSPSQDIPALSTIDARLVGLAYAPAGAGDPVGSGAWQVPFSLQSVTKVFALALLTAIAPEAATARFRTDSWAEDFRSTVPLDARESLAPNPFTNAGALVVVDQLMHHHDDVAAAVAGFICDQGADIASPTVPPAGPVTVDEQVAAGELANCHRNRALAHLLAERGLLDHPVPEVLEQYVRQCAVAADCGRTASAAGFLARGGLLRDGRRLLSPDQTRRLNALLLTCGAYQQSAAVAVEVGLPVKTGVGGGVLAVAPGRGTLCVWSPGLDRAGNPAAALTAAAAFTRSAGLSIF
ncbi:MAG TPA: glutaminase [Kineosporiaceae bacterium]|nr:glutaminase [Kineosporiaceae bacterium]